MKWAVQVLLIVDAPDGSTEEQVSEMLVQQRIVSRNAPYTLQPLPDPAASSSEK